MKQIKLTFVLTMLMSMVGLQAFAAWDTSTKVEKDGLYYYLDKDNNQAQMTSMAEGKYTGDIEIPNYIFYEEKIYSVTSIGGFAFSGCSGLTSVTIPNSVTSIGSYAFSSCSGLTSVTIGNSVTSIGNYAFSSCSGLTKVIVSDIAAWCGISFGDNPLYYAHHLYSDENTEITDLVIPDGVTSIGEFAFEYCSGLTSVTIPNSVTSIGQYAFYYCSGLTSITIPNSVTSIGYGAFSGCSGLTSVTIPNSVTSIGQYAFYYCSGLTSITIPNSVTSIGYGAFSGCSGLTSITVETGNTKYDSRNNCNAIIETASNTLIAGCKNTVILNGVTSIGGGAFSGCSGLTYVFIPNSVTSIGGGAFSGCSGLTSVTIGNSVTSIGSSAFHGCSGLSSITIPNSVTSIGSSAFYGCSGLSSVTIPNSVTSIGSSAFHGCSGLTKVIVSDIAAWCGISFSGLDNNPLNYAHHLFTDDNTEIRDLVIPDGVTSIGDYAFGGCYRLTSVTIPNSVTSIGSNAFNNCSGLTSVTIPNSVTSIGAYAFGGCYRLTSVTIGNSVTSIGDYAFEGCSGLTKVIVSDIAAWCGISFRNYSSNPLPHAHHLYSDENTEITDLVIPDGVTRIGNAAFEGCSGLTSVTIPNSVTSIGGTAFSLCSGLTSVTIPNSVTSIGNYAFRGCSSLSSVTIPNGVTSIGNSAFYVCTGLTSVTIPNSVTSIGDYAFSGCSGLTSVTAYNPTPVGITENVFTNRTNATLYLRQGSKEAYQAADYWKEFKEIIAIPTHYLIYVVDGNVYKYYNLAEGEPITPEAAPTKEGYTFSGWSEIPETMPTKDVMVTGTFTLVTGIKQIMSGVNNGAVIYTLDGKRASEPQRGLNIVRMSDGTTKKVVVK